MASRLAAVLRRAPEGLPPVKGGQLSSVRYTTNPMWPGIFTDLDARCQCTIGFLHGVRQVKVLNAMCPNHAGTVTP